MYWVVGCMDYRLEDENSRKKAQKAQRVFSAWALFAELA